MPFTVKNWQNSPNATTPISAEALEDMEDRLSDYTDLLGSRLAVNAKDSTYGAIGDGVNDDTAEITAALATGAHVYLPKGTYLVDNVTLATAGQRLFGDGPGLTILKNPGGAGDQVVTLTGAGARLSDVTVDGNKASVSSGAAGAVDIAAANAGIERCSVLSAYSYGIRLRDADGMFARDCRVLDSNSHGIFGVSSASAVDMQDMEISRCHVDRSGIAAGSVGATHGITVHGNTTGPKRIRRVRVADNTIVMTASPTGGTVSCGIEVWGYCPGSSVVGNTVVGSDFAISIDFSDYTTVSGNTVRNPDAYGIEIATSNACSVVGNTIDGAGNCSHGIIWTGLTDYGTVTGNSIHDVTDSGVFIGGGDRALVCGNLIKKATTAGIYFQAGNHGVAVGNFIDLETTGSNCIVYESTPKITAIGNVLKDYTAGGIAPFASSGTYAGTIQGNYFDSGAGSRINNLLSGTATSADLRIEPQVGHTLPSVASATTITLPLEGDVVSVTGTTNITSVTASYVGRRVTLIFAGALTFTDGSNLKLAGNLVTTADDTITLVSDGTNWVEVARSVN